MPKERSTAEPKDRRVSRRTKERAFPPTMGRARLLQPEGRADYGAGALVAARGARRPWGGRACCSPRGAPTMGRARLLQPEGRANHGRARLLQPEGRADHGAGALITAQRTGVPVDHGRARLLQPEGRADYGAGALVAARGTRRLWGGRAYCSPRDAPTMGRARLSQPKGQAFPLTVCGRACCSSAAAELAETFFRSCPWAGRTRQGMRSAATRAEQENPARSKAYRAFARRKHGKAGG